MLFVTFFFEPMTLKMSSLSRRPDNKYRCDASLKRMHSEIAEKIYLSKVLIGPLCRLAVILDL